MVTGSRACAGWWGNQELSEDRWTTQVEAGKTSRVDVFGLLFYEEEMCSWARLSGTEHSFWHETDLTSNSNSATN